MRAHSSAIFVSTASALAAVVLGLLMVGSVSRLHAQAPEGPDTTSGTTNDSTGLVTNVAPYRTITVNSRGGLFTYRLGPDLHVIGPDNHALKITQVLPGDEATVFYYLRDGQQTVARIVVLRRGVPARK